MKKGIWLFLGFWIFPLFLLSQKDTAIQYAARIDQAGLRAVLEKLASPEMEGRAAGTPGLEKAAAYISSQFGKMGLQSPAALQGFYQAYDFIKDTVLPRRFKIGDQVLHSGTDYFIPRGTQKQNEFKAKEIVFAGYGRAGKTVNDFARKNMKGRVVVIFPGEPKAGGQRVKIGNDPEAEAPGPLSESIKAAKSQGAVAMLVVDTASTNFQTPSVLISQTSQELAAADYLPVIYIKTGVLANIFGQQVADSLVRAIKSREILRPFQLRKKTKIKLAYGKEAVVNRANNVIGYVEGSDKKEEYVILSAHYDHLGSQNGKIFYGADDNGSGVSALLSMAKAFSEAKEAGFGPKRSVVFIAFSGEENGLVGSEYYVNHPAFRLEAVSALVNIDMIGRVQPGFDHKNRRDYLYVVGDDKRSSELPGLITDVNKEAQFILDYKYNSKNDPEMIYYRSDHYSFAKRGVPVVFFTNGTHKDYHLPTDTPDKINYEILEKRTRFIFRIAWEIANREGMLKRNLNTY